MYRYLVIAVAVAAVTVSNATFRSTDWMVATVRADSQTPPPQKIETLRGAVAAGANAGDVPRALTQYEALVAATNAPEPASLRAIADAAALRLTDATDARARFAACGIVLARGHHDGCLARVKSESATGTADEQAIKVFTLANAGYRPWPDMVDPRRFAASNQARLTIASTLTRLPASDRIDLVRPLLENDAARGIRIQAVSLLGNMGTDEARAMLDELARQQIDPNVMLAVQMARARLGAADAIPMLEQMRSTVLGSRASELSLALALGGSSYVADPAPYVALIPDVERAQLVTALAPRYPELTATTIRDLIANPAPNVRVNALHAAEQLAMGFDPVVFRRMADGDPAVRLAAIHAVLATIARHQAQTSPVQ